MSKLIPITLISIILAWCSQHSPFRKRLRDGTLRKDRVFYLALALCMIFFAGLRIHYNDTDTYRNTFEFFNINSQVDWRLGSNPGYNLVLHLFKRLGISSQTYFLVYSAFIIGIYLWFIRKYTVKIALAIFLFLTTGGFIFTLAALKQCTAVAFCVLAVDRYIQRKRIQYVVFIVLGILFHPYALMFLVLPLLDFTPWTARTYVLLLAFVVIGLALQPLLGTLVNITTMLGEEYDVNTFVGDGVNPFRVAVSVAPMFLSFLARRTIRGRNDRVQNICLNLAMLNGTIMFVGLFGTALYFGRLANYFLLFQCITIPWLLSLMKTNNRRVFTVLVAVGYSAYFIYANAINQPFDRVFYGMGLKDYISSLF